MKNYKAPNLTEYGKVGELTAIFGADNVQDQSFDLDGRVIDEGLGSIDQCPTANQEDCEFTVT